MQRRHLVGSITAALTLPAIARPAVAYSLADFERDFGQRERYFQPLDKPASDFTLRDPDGRQLSLVDLRDQVIVLHFVYTSCPDICPLHAEKLAEVQAMVNRTPMKDRVRF